MTLKQFLCTMACFLAVLIVVFWSIERSRDRDD